MCALPGLKKGCRPFACYLMLIQLSDCCQLSLTNPEERERQQRSGKKPYLALHFPVFNPNFKQLRQTFCRERVPPRRKGKQKPCREQQE